MRSYSILLLTFLLVSSIQHPASSIEYLTYDFEIIKELAEHRSPVLSAVFSPDGRLIATGSTDSNIKLWDANSGKQIRALMRHPSPILCVAFSPDSNMVASGSEAGAITLWDVNYKERIRILKGHEDRVLSMRFSPDGTILASGSADKTIRLWNMSSGKEVKTFKDHTDSVNSLCFSPNGKLLASGSGDGTVKLWNTDLQALEKLEASAPRGNNILTLKESTGTVNSICFSPDGKALASGSGDGTIRLWDVNSGNEVATLNGHKGAIGIDDCLSFSPDGRILVSGSADSRILVWNVSSLNIINELKAHTAAVDAVALSSNGRQMVSAGMDNVARLWKIRVTESLGVTLNARYEGWQRGVLKLSADVVGIADVVRFQYSFDGATWNDIAEIKQPPFSVDWNTRTPVPGVASAVHLRVIAERATGTRSMDQADTSFAIDNEPPKTKHDYDGLWHKEDFQINLSADDGNGTGLLTVKYRLNYGPERDIKWNEQPKITQEGINTLEYWSMDKLGNEAEHGLLSDVKLDKTGPEFLDWTKEPENLKESYAGTFLVFVRLTDKSGSGLAGKIPQFDYHIGSDVDYDGYEDMFQRSTDLWYYEIPVPPEGWGHYLGKTIYYKAKCEDLAGNVGRSAEQQQLIGILKTPPAVKVTTEFRNWERGPIVIKADASDMDGTIKNVRFEYSLDNISWKIIGTSDAPPYSVQWDTTADIPQAERTVWIQATAIDNDGLSANYVSPTFGIDNQPPTTSHDYDNLWRRTDFAVNLTADDGNGSGASGVKYRLNGGPERDVLNDGLPKIYEQGRNALEYWSIDAAGNEESHKVLSDIKLDRLPPTFEAWDVQSEKNILHVLVKIADTDSGIDTAPQFDYHIGTDTHYSGYKDMVKSGDNGWKYDVDISYDAMGKTMSCKVSAKDAVGNLGIKAWEYNIAGEPATVPTSVPSTVAEPQEEKPVEVEKNLEITPLPVVKKREESSVVWDAKTPEKVMVGENVEIQGQLRPEMGESLPLDITVTAPNDTIYTSSMDTDLTGAFRFSLPLNTEGQWEISAEWKGNDKYEPAKSKPCTIQAVPEGTPISASEGNVKKAGQFLKKNIIIIGLLITYVAIIRLYRG